MPKFRLKTIIAPGKFGIVHGKDQSESYEIVPTKQKIHTADLENHLIQKFLCYTGGNLLFLQLTW